MTIAISQPTKAISSAAARLSVAAVTTYKALLIALIFIRPDLDPSWHTISEWAIGPHGWIVEVAFRFLSYMIWLITLATQAIRRGHRNP